MARARASTKEEKFKVRRILALPIMYVWDVYVRTAWQDGKVATALGAVRRSEATAVWSGVVCRSTSSIVLPRQFRRGATAEKGENFGKTECRVDAKND